MPAIAPGEIELPFDEGVLPVLDPPLLPELGVLELPLESEPPLGVLIVPGSELPLPPPPLPLFVVPPGALGVVVVRVLPNCDALVARSSAGMLATFS